MGSHLGSADKVGERAVEGDRRVLAGVRTPTLPTAPDSTVLGTTSCFGRCCRHPACPFARDPASAAPAPVSSLDPYGCTGGLLRTELGSICAGADD
eukprot:1325465-Pyramimonas_sp.AAC.1